MRSFATLVTLWAALLAVATAAETAPDGKPWFDERLRDFFAVKEKQARALVDELSEPVAPEIWTYFALGKKGNWAGALEAGEKLLKRSHQGGARTVDPLVTNAVWPAAHETYLAYHVMKDWPQKYFDQFASEIIKSIPPGSIYFGGTDPGRGIITVACKSQPDGDPFFTLTQNQVADSSYISHLRAMYGSRINVPSEEKVREVFQEYVTDAAKRKAEGKLKNGEVVREVEGRLFVDGVAAVMRLSGMIVKTIVDANPSREVFIEESYELDQLYPFLTPHGLVMQLNRKPVAEIPADAIAKDRAYWTQIIAPMIGDWVRDDTSLDSVAKFAQRTFIAKDYTGFKGDVANLTNYQSRATFAKCRTAIGGIYAWRSEQAGRAEMRQKMASEAALAFKQAFALCPNMPDVIGRYSTFLESEGKRAETLRLIGIALRIGGDEPKDTEYLRKLDEYYRSLEREGRGEKKRLI
jgi:hypothetical protein